MQQSLPHLSESSSLSSGSLPPKQSFTQILRLDGYIQNIYMVVYPDKILLLDGCTRVDVDLVLNTIRDILGRDINELKAVIVTHMHADHAGGASYLRQKTGCQVISANKPNQWYSGFNGRIEHLIDLSLSYFVAYRQGKPIKNINYPAELNPDIVVNDGEPVPMFEDWQILETPGHTDRDLSVYHPQTGKIYVADLIIRLNSRKSGEKFVNPYIIHNPLDYTSSITKVKILKPSQVMMAHGGQSFIREQVFEALIAMTPNKPRTNKAVYNDVVFRMRTNKKSKQKRAT